MSRGYSSKKRASTHGHFGKKNYNEKYRGEHEGMWAELKQIALATERADKKARGKNVSGK